MLKLINKFNKIIEDHSMSNPTPLTGERLFNKVKELAHLSRRKRAIECGYYKIDENGKIRANLKQFYNALLAASGVNIVDISKPSPPRNGKDLTYEVTVQENGRMVIGSAYIEKMGLKPGDKFTMKLGYKHITLSKIEENDRLYSYFA